MNRNRRNGAVGKFVMIRNHRNGAAEKFLMNRNRCKWTTSQNSPKHHQFVFLASGRGCVVNTVFIISVNIHSLTLSSNVNAIRLRQLLRTALVTVVILALAPDIQL